MMDGGYGRGWREQKALGVVARFRQWMREPAGTYEYILGGAILALGLLLISRA